MEISDEYWISGGAAPHPFQLNLHTPESKYPTGLDPFSPLCKLLFSDFKSFTNKSWQQISIRGVVFHLKRSPEIGKKFILCIFFSKTKDNNAL
jgi:hypothetical protein